MKKTKSFYVSLVSALLIFTIPLIYVVLCKVNGYLIILNEFILYFVIALIAFGISSIFVFLKVIPGCVKIIFTLIILVFAFGLFSAFNYFGGSIEFDIYRGIEGINEYNGSLSPDESGLYVETENYGDFEDITYYCYNLTGIFPMSTKTKIIKYDDVNFQKEVDKINNEMSFYDSPVGYGEPIPVFSFEGFDFRLEKAGLWYPKEMYFVGINDDTNEIAYVFFQDYESDTVWEYKDFLNSYAGWSYVIKDREKTK